MNVDETLSKEQSPRMFDAIAKRYDILNRLLSLGQDLNWRKALVNCLPADKDIELLDLATGTADVLITLAKHNAKVFRGVGVDPSAGMLAIGRKKISDQQLEQRLFLQQGSAEELTFLNDSFDVVTISFGIRNIPNLRPAFLEIFRVIKPGGTFIVLEFSKPSNPVLALGHWFYLNTVVPCVGFLFSGNFKAYQYLNKTIQTFPHGEQFCNILNQFGFINIRRMPLMGGVATIYSAYKPVAA